jgi:integrase
MSRQSTRKPLSRKAASRPRKPDPGFPLTPHSCGAWVKKIRGKIHYFGRWANRARGVLVRIEGDGWKEALEKYKAVADDLHAGRTPRVQSDGLTVTDLCNRFLTAKLRKVETGEIGPRMFADYKEITDLLVAAFGKTRLVDDLAADDFEALRAQMAEKWGPVRLGNAITRTRSVFRYGQENGLIDKAVRYGGEFKKPGQAVLRRHRAEQGERMIDAAELRRILDALAGQPVQTGRTDEETGEPETVTLEPNPALRAMVLLGVNSGFGNADCAALPRSALDLDAGWLNFPRPKTGIARRCPLWSETIVALRDALAVRPEPRHDQAGGLVFLTALGTPFIHTMPTGERTDNVSVLFRKALKKIGLHRERIGFYTLRHVFRTIADAARDHVAIDMIMGHSDQTIAGHYRERIDDDRLQAVAEHVRGWLFGQGPSDGTTDDQADTLSETEPNQREEAEAESRPTLRVFAG